MHKLVLITCLVAASLSSTPVQAGSGQFGRHYACVNQKGYGSIWFWIRNDCWRRTY